MGLHLPSSTSRYERDKWDDLWRTVSGDDKFKLDPAALTGAVDSLFASMGGERAKDRVVARKVRERIVKKAELPALRVHKHE